MPVAWARRWSWVALRGGSCIFLTLLLLFVFFIFFNFLISPSFERHCVLCGIVVVVVVDLIVSSSEIEIVLVDLLSVAAFTVDRGANG